MTDNGWPTLADVHAAVTDTRAEVRELAADVRAELRAQRQDLDEHRADDRRELDRLNVRQWRIALAVAGLAALPAAALGSAVGTIGG